MGAEGLPVAPSRAFSNSVAWYGAPEYANGSVGNAIYTYSSVNAVTGAIQAHNITTPGFSPEFLGEQYASPIFDGGDIIIGQASDSNSSDQSLFIYNTTSGASTRASLNDWGGVESSGAEVSQVYLTPLSSYGGNIVGIFNKESLNETWALDYDGDLEPSPVYTNYLAVQQGSSFQQVSTDHYQIIPTSCQYFINGTGYTYSVLFDPTVIFSAVAGGGGRYAYAVADFDLDKLSPDDCQPITYGTDVKLYLSDGSTVASFNPYVTNDSKGYSTCYEQGPCFVGFLGFWGNLLVYQTCASQAACYAGSYNYTLYNANTYVATPINVPFEPDTIQTDGNQMAWVGQDGNVYVYDPSSGIKQVTAAPFDPDDEGYYSDSLRLSGGVVAWLNSTGYANFYTISTGAVTSVKLAPDADPSAYVPVNTANYVPLFDFKDGRAAWVLLEETGYVLWVFNLNGGVEGQAKISVNLGWGTGVNDLGVDDIVVTGTWIYVQVNLKNNQFPQIFAIRPPPMTPVIVIPGVAATTLFSGAQQLWPGAIVPSYAKPQASSLKAGVLCDGWWNFVPFSGTNCGDRFNLLLNSTGGPTASVRTGRILDFTVLNNILWQGSDPDVYGALETTLGSLGYVNGTSMFLFGYNWEVDNAIHYLQLDTLIGRIQNSTGSDQVIIVAHSMGGVISWGYMLSSTTRALNVQSLITIDTPYWGAPKAYYALVDGYNFGNPTVDQVTAKILAQNATAAYELVSTIPFVLNLTAYPYGNNIFKVGSLYDACYYSPSSCFNTQEALDDISYKGFNVTYSSGNPRSILLGQGHNPERAGTTIVSITPSWGVAWSPNPFAIETTQLFGASWGNYTNPNSPMVPTYALIGDGYQTLDGFVMRPATPAEIASGSYVTFNGVKVVLVPHFSDGDGTVPLRNQQMNAQDVNTFYFRYTGGAQTAHVPMASNANAMSVITEILTGVSTSKVCQNGSLCSMGYQAGSLGQTPDKEYRTTDFTLHSNAQLVIFGENDTRLGLSPYGGFSEDIPTGTFLDVDGVEYAAIRNATTPLSVYVNGTSSGEFSLDVSMSGAENMSFSYNDVAVTNGTMAHFVFNPQLSSSSLPSLQVTSPSGQTMMIPANSTGTVQTAQSSQSSSGSSTSTSSPTSTTFQGTSTIATSSAPSTSAKSTPSGQPILLEAAATVATVVVVALLVVRRKRGSRT